MVARMNNLDLLGHVTRDPERKKAMALFGLAVDDSYGSGADRVEKTVFVDVGCTGALAERVMQYVKKGDQVLVEGHLAFDRWDKDGEPRSKHWLRARTIQFLGGGKREEAPAGEPERGVGDDLPF